MLFHQARSQNFPAEFEERYSKEAQLCRQMLSSRPEERPSTWEMFQIMMHMGVDDQARRLMDQSALLGSMQNTIALQRNEIDELSRGNVGAMTASMAPSGEPSVVIVESALETRMIYTGPWTAAKHVGCFWGFRAQVHAMVMAMFTSEHAIQCEAQMDATGEYGAWSLRKDNIVKVHVDLYHMVARALWEKSLAWMLGPPG